MIAVDVVCGPLLTLVLFNPSKPRRELLLDLTVVGLLQVAALGYGLFAVFSARPVHMVFEYHRMAVVHAADVDPATLMQAPQGLQVLLLFRPTLLSLRTFKNGQEQYESTMVPLGGVPQAAQPALWQSWDAARAEICTNHAPLQTLSSVLAPKRRSSTAPLPPQITRRIACVTFRSSGERTSGQCSLTRKPPNLWASYRSTRCKSTQ